MDYPFHEISIQSVEVYIEGDGDTTTPMPVGFRIDLYEADSAGPGNLLASRLVFSAKVEEEKWNRVEFDPPVPVDSGRFTWRGYREAMESDWARKRNRRFRGTPGKSRMGNGLLFAGTIQRSF